MKKNPIGDPRFSAFRPYISQKKEEKSQDRKPSDEEDKEDQSSPEEVSDEESEEMIMKVTVKLLVFMTQRIGEAITIAELEEETGISKDELSIVVNLLVGIAILTIEDDEDNFENSKVTMPHAIKLPQTVIEEAEKEYRECAELNDRLKILHNEIKESEEFKKYSCLQIEELEQAFNLEKDLDEKLVIIETPEGTNIESKWENDRHRVRISNLPENAKMFVLSHPAASQKDPEQK